MLPLPGPVQDEALMDNPRSKFAVAVVVLLLAAACAPDAVPFQQRAEGAAAYGYSDAKLDATHYSVAYSDSNAKSADAFMELRAAQIAQGAGFRYFAFDKRGTALLRHTVSDLSSDAVR